MLNTVLTIGFLHKPCEVFFLFGGNTGIRKYLGQMNLFAKQKWRQRPREKMYVHQVGKRRWDK